MTQDKSPFTVTYTSVPVEGVNAGPTTTFIEYKEPPPSNDPNCPKCGGKGELLFMYDRPGGLPGNSMLPCDVCRKSE
jgi:hypothetical protein